MNRFHLPLYLILRFPAIRIQTLQIIMPIGVEENRGPRLPHSQLDWVSRTAGGVVACPVFCGAVSS